MTANWQVWHVYTDRGTALVVDEGDKDHCTEGAGRRNATAARLSMTSTRFEALPPGEEPGFLPAGQEE